MESARVGSLVAEIERKKLWVGDLTGSGVKAGALEVLRTIREPVGLGHGLHEDGLGFGGRFVFLRERRF